MKFSKLIKTTYALLEQEGLEGQELPDAANAEDVEKAAGEIDKAGEKMQSTVETTMETLVEILKKLVNFLREEERVGNAKYPPKMVELLKNIKAATMTADAASGLSQIEDAIDEAEKHYTSQKTSF